jgi:transcriptional regulator with XRE-family HTH domain
MRMAQQKSLRGTDLLPIQCKMARTAVGLGVRELAAAAKVSVDTVVRFEGGENLRERTIDAIRASLEAAGVEFIPENGGGPGVRLTTALKEKGSRNSHPVDGGTA